MTSWMPRREGTPISVDGSRRSKCCEAMGWERWEQNGEGSVPYRDRAYCIGNRFFRLVHTVTPMVPGIYNRFCLFTRSPSHQHPLAAHHAPRTTHHAPLVARHCCIAGRRARSVSKPDRAPGTGVGVLLSVRPPTHRGCLPRLHCVVTET